MTVQGPVKEQQPNGMSHRGAVIRRGDWEGPRARLPCGKVLPLAWRLLEKETRRIQRDKAETKGADCGCCALRGGILMAVFMFVHIHIFHGLYHLQNLKVPYWHRCLRQLCPFKKV